jgi:hypothetical protein
MPVNQTGRSTRMVTGAVAERVSLQMREAADHVDVLANVGKRLENRRQLERSVDAGVHWFWMTPLAM